MKRNHMILSLKKFHTFAGWFIVLARHGVQLPAGRRCGLRNVFYGF